MSILGIKICFFLCAKKRNVSMFNSVNILFAKSHKKTQ